MSRLLTSTLASLGIASSRQNTQTTSVAKCETFDSTITYDKFIEPELESYASSKSHYNFIHDSLPYRTSNIKQLTLYDNYMNDVLSFNNINKWKRITKCLNNDKYQPHKQLLCKSLMTDYYIAAEDIDSAQSTIKSAFNTIQTNKKYDINNLCKYDREELYVFGFYEWIVNFDQKSAQKIFRFISNEYPFDLYAAKRAQEMSFDLSDWESMLNIFLDIKPYHHVNGLKNPLKDAETGNKLPSPYYNGMLSFSYEQMGLLKTAEKYAMEGLKYYIDDNWLHHSLIHSRYFQQNTENDIKNLIKYIIDNGSEYWNINEKHAFITTHNWWHIALLYLELDDIESAMKIFKQHIWRDNLVCRAEQIGALSMVWILSMIIDSKINNIDYYNYIYKDIISDIDEIWESMMEFVYETNQNVNVGYKLYDVLFMRGVIEMKSIYGKGGRKQNLEKYRKYDKCFNKLRNEMIDFCGNNVELKDKYIGIIDAMSLMYDNSSKDMKNNLNQAYDILSLIVNDLNIIGGSREQRFVFDQMFIDLLIKNQQQKELKEFLECFLAKYPIKSLEMIALIFK